MSCDYYIKFIITSCSYSKLKDKLQAINSNLSKEKNTLKAMKRNIRISCQEKANITWYDDPILKGVVLRLMNTVIYTLLTDAVSMLVVKEEDLCETEILVLRRYAMNILIYKNLQRSGTIKNLTLDEYKRKIVDGSHIVILVTNHKTTKSFGSAKVVVESTLIPVIER